MPKIIHSENGHEVTIVGFQKLADGALAVCHRCCGNPSTDSWQNLYAVHGLDTASVDKKIADRAKDVAGQHASITAAEKYIQEQLISADVHPDPHFHTSNMELLD